MFNGELGDIFVAAPEAVEQLRYYPVIAYTIARFDNRLIITNLYFFFFIQYVVPLLNNHLNYSLHFVVNATRINKSNLEQRDGRIPAIRVPEPKELVPGGNLRTETFIGTHIFDSRNQNRSRNHLNKIQIVWVLIGSMNN